MGLLTLPLLLTFAASASAAGDARDSDSPFGVLDFVAWDHDWNGHHYGGDKVERAAALMQEAGVGFVRMDFLWSDIEPEKGRFDFARYDRIVDTLRAHDIRILGLLHYNVPWASKHWNDAPDPALYTRYAAETVKHFKDRVKYWEIWNEPDYAVYWQPQDDMKSYTELLKKVYPALKAADPTCAVVLGGLSQSPSIQLKRIYHDGGKEFFDVVNLHPFVDPSLPNVMELLRGTYRSIYKEMAKNGDAAKPIWFTEIGCPGVDSGAKGWFLGKSQTEAEQARWVERVYNAPLEWPGVKKIFWAFFRDTDDHFKNDIDRFGLVREDFSKKPAFEAYKKIAKR